MFFLPRGLRELNGGPVRLASTAWATPQEIEQAFSYRNHTSLFVGAIPNAIHWDKLMSLTEQTNEIRARIDRSFVNLDQRTEWTYHISNQLEAVYQANCTPLGLNDDRHFVTIAGSRSGKGTSAIIPNLCLYSGSVICLDPKGENASRTAVRRGKGNKFCEGMGQEVFVVDPFHVADVPDELRASFNPLTLLDPKSPSIVEDAAILAEALVIPPHTGDDHWSESAKNFIKGLLLHLITTVENPNLLTLRSFLTRGDTTGWEQAYDKLKSKLRRQTFLEEFPTAFSYLLNRMRQDNDFDGIIAGAAETLLTCAEEERGSILSTARRNTAFLDTTNVHFKKTLAGNNPPRPLPPDIFKEDTKGASLFLCLPAQYMNTHGRWLRLMIGLLLNRLYQDTSPPKSGAPVLFILEEFHSLGYMPVIEKASGYAAGFGIKLWAILQDLPQLKALYPNSWQTFLANAGAIQVFGVSDDETTSYISKALGDIAVIQPVYNHSKSSTTGQSTTTDYTTYRPPSPTVVNQAQGASDSTSWQLYIVPLLRTDEIVREFARENNTALLLIKGYAPIWCMRINYYNSPWFQGWYLPDRRDRTPFKNPPSFGVGSPLAFRKAVDSLNWTYFEINQRLDVHDAHSAVKKV